jgi:Peptidase M1 N-terminal domain/Peptidase family M1 domain
LSIEPDLDAFTFAGECAVEFAVDAAKLNENNDKRIILHAKELAFVSAEYKVVSSEGSASSSAAVKADEINVSIAETTVAFVFPTAIPSDAAKLVLTVSYVGILNNQMAGFYRSSYTDIDGNSKIMGSTQFEALDARRAFPCVDEPAAKAVFGLSMTIPAHLTCFSNMPEASAASLSRTKKRVAFLDTPKMSTYLLAFCVGEFDCVQRMTPVGGVLVKVYTPPGKAAMGNFALDCAVKCLDHYDAFFQTPYPLPKLDMVAIPEFAMVRSVLNVFFFKKTRFRFRFRFSSHPTFLFPPSDLTLLPWLRRERWCVTFKWSTGLRSYDEHVLPDRSGSTYTVFFVAPCSSVFLFFIPLAIAAQENWGLVTYREVDLLIDAVKASNQQKQRVAVVVAHELAHQWFGNLVTMQVRELQHTKRILLYHEGESVSTLFIHSCVGTLAFCRPKQWWNGLWLNEST